MDIDGIFHIAPPQDFKRIMLQVFNDQFHHNPVYRSFCDLLYVHPSEVSDLKEIPFLPVELFKTQRILRDSSEVETIFTSSGTTGATPGKHHVADLLLYQKSFTSTFTHFYGSITGYTILALLPSYLQRSGSSLIYMVKHLIDRSKKPHSGFYLDDLAELANTLRELDGSGERVLLIGVSYALLDLIEVHSFALKNTIVMETGGMKGRRKELIRSELHQHLKKGFGVDSIHSEYGMTELLSQAYSKGEGHFLSPPWMKILIRDPEDPKTLLSHGQSGGINVIDLANIYSCAFIATQDLGKAHADGSFEVLGRFDHADVRGCNLMV